MFEICFFSYFDRFGIRFEVFVFMIIICFLFVHAFHFIVLDDLLMTHIFGVPISNVIIEFCRILIIVIMLIFRLITLVFIINMFVNV